MCGRQGQRPNIAVQTRRADAAYHVDTTFVDPDPPSFAFSYEPIAPEVLVALEAAQDPDIGGSISLLLAEVFGSEQVFASG